jgi:hypothetical protein
LVVTPPRRVNLTAAGYDAADIAAVSVSTITMAADVEQLAAFRIAAKELI